MHRRTGIVLQYKGRNISVLETEAGRIDAHFYTSQFSKTRVQRGSIISYFTQRDKHQNVVLQDVDVEHVPLEWGRHDIHFLHYLLEVCYYFVPEGAGCRVTFSFFISLFENYSFFSTNFHKKLVLCRVFSELGIYPHETTIQACVQELLKKPIDNLIQADLQLANEDLLNQWLEWSIETHPQRKWFKAMPLLLKSD